MKQPSISLIVLMAVSMALLMAFCSKTRGQLANGQEQEDQTVVTTAKQLIERVDSGKGPRYVGSPKKPQVAMSDFELEMAAKIFRERFPFKSIRPRLAFQGKHVFEVIEEPDSPRVRWFTNGPSKLVRDDAGHEFKMSVRGRTQGLLDLHSEEVAEFIQREGQGLSRIPRSTPYDLRRTRDYASKIYSKPVGSDLKGESLRKLRSAKKDDRDDPWVYSTDGLPSRDLVERFHGNAAQGFASPNSTGLVRDLDQVSGFESHRIRLSNRPGRIPMADHLPNLQEGNFGIVEDERRLKRQAGIRWYTNQLQLVSLLMHETPRVYVSKNLPNMEELSSANAKTRNVNDFEAAALAKLKAGEELVIQATLNRIRMVGAVRSSRTCLQCHSGKENDMLGAFSYEFLRSPKVKEAPAF